MPKEKTFIYLWSCRLARRAHLVYETIEGFIVKIVPHQLDVDDELVIISPAIGVCGCIVAILQS